MGDLHVSRHHIWWQGKRLSRDTRDICEGHGGVVRTHSTDEGGELAQRGASGGKGGTRRCIEQQKHVGTQKPDKSMSTKIERITELARENRQLQFLSIAHLLTPELLTEAFKSLRKDASAGVDGVTYEEYRNGANSKIQQLHERVRTMKYRAQPLRRIYIPKEDGKQRPISIPTVVSFCTSCSFLLG